MILQKNSFKFRSGVAYIKEKGGTIIIDRLIYKAFKNFNWSISCHGYVRSGKNSYLHHYVLGKPPKGLVTDHINRNKLDNRKCNLRFVTHAQNMRNIKTTNRYGKNGIKLNNNKDKFVAVIKVSGKAIHLGTFKYIEDAIKAKTEAENKYWQ